MRVKNLTFLILLFKVFVVLSVETAETNVSISTAATTTANNEAPAVTNLTSTGSNQSHHETGSLSAGNHTVESLHNSTSQNGVSIVSLWKENNGAVLRAFYVVVGVTAIIVVYFVIRSVRLRRKRSKTRKYGITGKNIDLEMTPLDQEDDEDDLTVFEVPKHSKR